MNRNGVVAPLFEGPLDIVGDVHGEIEPLRQLLEALGYDETGVHPQGRRLVFVGDLGDRGPDSPAVFDLVRSLVERGLAQCLLGNHELNLLRGASKSGNRWFIDPTHREQQPGGEFAHGRPAPEGFKVPCLAFLAALPMALEREDLRVVHAAWVPGEIDRLRAASGSIVDLYRQHERETLDQIEREGLRHAADEEEARWQHRLTDPSEPMPLLTAFGDVDARYQMGSPIRVVTSGVERLARKPFWANGKWRMCDRVKWWDEYEEATPVVIGHYWRQVAPIEASQHASEKPELFVDGAPTDWVGARANVFCVDFSVGGRYQERKAGVKDYATHLAAMRWPERELWFETGRVG